MTENEAKEMSIREILEEYSKYISIGTIEEFKALKEKNNEHYSDTDELDGYGYTCTNKTCVERIRNKAIDEFAEKIFEYCSMSDMNRKMIKQIAEQMKAGGVE